MPTEYDTGAVSLATTARCPAPINFVIAPNVGEEATLLLLALAVLGWLVCTRAHKRGWW